MTSPAQLVLCRSAMQKYDVIPSRLPASTWHCRVKAKISAHSSHAPQCLPWGKSPFRFWKGWNVGDTKDVTSRCELSLRSQKLSQDLLTKLGLRFQERLENLFIWNRFLKLCHLRYVYTALNEINFLIFVLWCFESFIRIILYGWGLYFRHSIENFLELQCTQA